MQRKRSFFTRLSAHGDAQVTVWGGTLPGALPRCLAHAPSEWEPLQSALQLGVVEVARIS